MEQKKEAVYLINDERYLHLRENGAGVGFATYNKVTGEPLESGQISEKNLPPDGRNAISAARNWYLFELSDDDRKVIQQESVQILENIPQAGIGRRRIWEPETLPKDIRLINSHYDDLYRIPDGGVIQVDYPDGRSFTARVEHLDDYHFDMGGLGNVFHICQFAEVMERNHADFYPEIQTQDEQAAWELGGKGYLAIQSCEDGWDYTLYHSDYSVMDGGQLDAPELTIQEAREQILEAHHMEKGRRVLKDYDLIMLKEGFYHRPLTVIRPIDIENFLKGMRRDGRSDSYISKARGMLYQIFQKAEANDLVRRNPVRLAEKMRATGTAKRKEAFTTAEVAHLMKVLPDDRMGLSIRLLLGTGMRMQELLALEPQFIEEDGSVIHIRQAVKVVKGTVSIGSPKSKDSIRDIPVPLNVRSCAIKLRDTTDQFIWESPKTGLPCNPTHFRDVFRKSLEEAGDVRLLTPHSCRHTYVSQMQALGVDIQTIQSIVGHADTEMTEHYLHVQESIRQSAIQLFSEAFSA